MFIKVIVSTKMFRSHVLEKVKITIRYCCISTKVTKVKFQLKYKMLSSEVKMDDSYLSGGNEGRAAVTGDLVIILLP